ncbi:Catalase [Desulfitobacterium hafniense DCB-2]|uniref:Catalase n=1 Tax=Desulfitobacterium hafniense (strain DSM 10664 / DCB-2) TaxID=272564 RepID=B8FZL5_DESHD|nr:catalase [Desulfitobacterium hafniense]ACL19089.1 Catalase [Desulfitobacterium hafniense DCB-2]
MKDNKPNKKREQLEPFIHESEGKKMTSNEGITISDDENTLTAGERGPTLIEDFLSREKLAHFDRERIPERVVHARGYGAHGEFQPYESLADLTMADFLQDPNKKTPLFVRFSQVVGSKGCNETNRDVRGFSIKFYTDEGNFDLIAINMPVFFIQDAIKFPDLIHAVKPEPDNEYPQGQTDHNTFWDFMANNKETAHMSLWIASNRAFPKSFRTMEGFGVHTFRLVNKDGKSHFVKFHIKPLLGVHSLIWDEAQRLGSDADFHRRDLWENIEIGNYPEYEMAIQVIKEEDEFAYDFDLLDPTKLWPEEEIPLRRIGKIILNRNVENAFAETEQSAFHPGNIVRGIDFSNDPLLQGRLFSYTDAQQARLGPNHQQLPINRPVCPFANNQRDGASRLVIDRGKVAYHRNGLANNSPYTVPGTQGGFVTYPSTVEGHKVRSTAPSFKDHYSQAKMFWNSMSEVEKRQIIGAYCFELGKCGPFVRQEWVDVLAHISTELAKSVSKELGTTVPADVEESPVTKSSPALSLHNTIFVPDTLRVAVFLAQGFDGPGVSKVLETLAEAKLRVVIVHDTLGKVSGTEGVTYEVHDSFLTGSPLVYDGILIVGSGNITPYFTYTAQKFTTDIYNHFKPIGIIQKGDAVLEPLGLLADEGIVTDSGPDFAGRFIKAMAKQRFWNRPSFLYPAMV